MGYGWAKQGKINARARVLAERTEALTGTRNSNPASEAKVAVTKDNAAQMGAIALRSTRVTAAPTMDQHNALVEDLRQIAAVLNAIGAKFSGL